MSANAHVFNVQLAKELGLNQAIMLQHLYYWHQINDKNKNNIIDGKVWTYNTAEAFSEIFPYLSPKQIRYAFEQLEKKNYIEIGNYNKANFDQTKWYCLTSEALLLFGNSNLQNVTPMLQNDTPNLPFVTPIPDNNTDNNTDSISDVSSIDDIKGKMFFKLVDLYPKARIGNRQHGLKKFKVLTPEECKESLLNCKRYLKLAGTYVKSLQNYIEEKCFTEDWLCAQEKLNKKPNSTTHNFTQKY